jgi:hypothetical protein
MQLFTGTIESEAKSVISTLSPLTNSTVEVSNMAKGSLPKNLSIDNLQFGSKPTKRNFRDIEGQRFGRHVVIGYKGSRNGQHSEWYCKCDCGIIHVVTTNNLLRGTTKSCGCLNSELCGNLKATHGMSRTRVYSTWSNMIGRCTRKSSSSYARYGGAGITVCERWRLSFENFFADMGGPPSADHSIERIDRTRGYEPSNCRWADRTEQQNNREVNHRVTIDGRTQTLAEWCREFGINGSTVRNRIGRGWSPEKALTTKRRQ